MYIAKRLYIQAKLAKGELTLGWNDALRKKAQQNAALPKEQRSKQGSFIWLFTKLVWDINPTRPDAEEATMLWEEFFKMSAK